MIDNENSGKNTKPRSFRIDDDTAERFKQIAGTIGGNQQETLAKLIESFEFQQGKALITDKKSEIERFENYITILTRMYMDSLEENQNTKILVSGQYEAVLKSKDTVIQDMQKKLEEAIELKNDAVSKYRKGADEKLLLGNQLDSMKKDFLESKTNHEKILADNRIAYETALADKEDLNEALKETCDNLKESLNVLKEENQKLKKDVVLLGKLVKENESLNQECKDLKHALQKEVNNSKEISNAHKQQEKSLLERFERDFQEKRKKDKEEADLSHQKALFELEKTYRIQLHEVEEKKKKEIDEYQKKYFNLLEKLESTKQNH